MKLLISEHARADLLNIGSYIADDNPARAATFIDELQDVFALLATLPRMATRVPGSSNLRYHPYGEYVITYAHDAESVTIARVIHSAADFLRL